ncbi:phage Mu protein gp30-like protein [Canicola haemoglobinophilus]|uniref:Phage Mu protein gp30-like protein n=1 Tax=Canicola haemoglobinophilus TaxID=733 RepID=A0AB38H9N2_9PAST|nr:phage Mu protein gp30-like protein [Canicola haemoglobinophilus]STO68942.1 phage Mu protein gp30-like protein [Canicola haemoglobinophilus]
MLGLVGALRKQVEGALQQPQSPFLMDSDNGFKVFDTQRFLAVVKKLAENDRSLTAENLAQEFVKRGNQQNTREVTANLQRQTGVNLQGFLGNSPALLEKVNLLTTANTQLIKSISNQYLDKVQTAVTQSVMTGKLNADLAKEIRQIGNVTESRARLIARDQSSKLNATLTQVRYQDVGIKKYRWSTSGDERVRTSHAENDGKIFSYDDPPETGHPGHEINCRCVQIPVLDDNLKPQAEEKTEKSNGYISGKRDLADLIEQSIGGGGNKLFSDIGVVRFDLVELAKESIGLDISDWKHNVDESGIRHTFKHHGNDKTEQARGQRAVTKADILLLPMIISNFDSIEYAGPSDLGNDTFLIRKEIDDEIFTVQEVRKKHKKLTMKTMWIRKKSKKKKP